MAGYAGYSKSNNALFAEQDGKMTATALAKMIGRGATAAAVAAVLPSREWHHTSKNYNMTFYYDIDAIAEERMVSVESLAELVIAASVKQVPVKVYENCVITWLEWSGTMKRRTATERTAIGVQVVDKGKTMLEITKENGVSFRKKRDCRGIKIVNAEGIVIAAEDGWRVGLEA